jgi:hypothetical protein
MRLDSISAVAIAATFVAGLASGGEAQRRAESAVETRTSSDSAWDLRVESVYPLEPVTSAELTGASTAHRMGSSGRGMASATGRGFSADFTGMFRTTDPAHQVRRRLTGLWRLEVPLGTDADDINVRYEVVAPDGQVGFLGHRESTGHLPAEIRAEPIRIVRYEGTSAVLEGEAELVVDISKLQHAGSYGGTVRVTVAMR